MYYGIHISIVIIIIIIIIILTETRPFIEMMNESNAQSTWEETKIKNFKLGELSFEQESSLFIKIMIWALWD